MIPTAAGSPGARLKSLLEEMQLRRTRYDRMASYLDNTQAIPITADKSVREAYRRLMALSRTNYAELVVEVDHCDRTDVTVRLG